MKKEILLAHFLKMTPKKAKDLMRVFFSFENAWQADFEALKKTGWDEATIQEFIEWKKNINEEKIQETLNKEKIICITQEDSNYPRLLKEIYDPPLCLFVRGTLQSDDFALAVVGPRKCSSYGQQVTEMLVGPLAEAGITIVSGLALGIDGIAHDVALKANGRTVAVLGGGVDEATIQPRSHYGLSERILEQGGAIISEYPPFTKAMNFTFPARNRIIAGMTLGTLVIEAGESSGSLITATCALDSNREVFAVPQNITTLTSVGVNTLVKMGAKVVLSCDDILQTLNLQEIKKYVQNTQIIPNSPTEEILLNILTKEPIHIDEIIKKSALPSHEVSSAMTLMEMKGKVKNVGGMMYIKKL